MRKVVLWSLMLALTACSGGDGSGDASSDTGLDTGSTDTDNPGPDPDPTCEAVGFAVDVSEWALPDVASQSEDPIDDLAEDYGCGESSFTSSLVDLTGDGLPDLVVTDHCDARKVGTTKWEVYTNTGSGFAATATDWALPDVASQSEDPIDDLYEDYGCGESSFTSALLDLTGDGRPDLVVTDHCDARKVGTTKWEVYANTGSGFSDTPTDWSLPTVASPNEDPIDDLAEDYGCGDSSFTSAVLDLTGDGRPDLVVTDHCDARKVGTTKWEVYENTGSGFADTATDWALPTVSSPNEDPIDDLYESYGCGDSSFKSSVIDLTGDGRPDLVVTDHCDARKVGTTKWEVYENTGSGFASTPTDWALPSVASPDEDPIDDLAEDYGCGESSFTSATLDLTGDGLPDLVVTDHCDARKVGTTKWEVYANTGAGFSSTAEEWNLPDLGSQAEDPMDDLFEDYGCGESSFTATVMDLNGDGAKEIVVTDACDARKVGTTRWDYYAGVCGFSQ